jgi:hypothetical protein
VKGVRANTAPRTRIASLCIIGLLAYFGIIELGNTILENVTNAPMLASYGVPSVSMDRYPGFRKRS